jgi:hypothetical protein
MAAFEARPTGERWRRWWRQVPGALQRIVGQFQQEAGRQRLLRIDAGAGEGQVARHLWAERVHDVGHRIHGIGEAQPRRRYREAGIGEAMRRSQAAASPKPPPKQMPEMAAMVGKGKLRIAAKAAELAAS